MKANELGLALDSECLLDGMYSIQKLHVSPGVRVRVEYSAPFHRKVVNNLLHGFADPPEVIESELNIHDLAVMLKLLHAFFVLHLSSRVLPWRGSEVVDFSPSTRLFIFHKVDRI
jgi:hypothetical protein